MFVRVHKPKPIGSGRNTGSSYDMLNYLDKENKDLSESEQTYFFNQYRSDISLNDSINLIDDNVVGSKLGKNDAKFYMISIDPSHDEIKHLIKLSTGKEVDSFDLLDKEDKAKFNVEFQKFVNGSMEHYADLMDREIDGRKMDINDLVYVAKIETERTYKPESKEVKENSKIFNEIRNLKYNSDGDNSKKIDELESKLHKTKSGEVIKAGTPKEGLNVHAHIVVSRMDKEQKTKMSPLTNVIKNDHHKIGDREVKIGFSRTDFALRVENDFDSRFDYKRTYESSTYGRLKNDRELKLNNVNFSYAFSSYNRLMGGRFDTLDFVEFASKVGFDAAKKITNTALSINTAGTTTPYKVVQDIIKLNPEKFLKMSGLNSNEQTLISLSKLNLIENIKSQTNVHVKELIKSGGMN